jgi:PleD family two-component response regulator
MSDPADLIRLADKAMYTAKNSGRNKVFAQRDSSPAHG